MESMVLVNLKIVFLETLILNLCHFILVKNTKKVKNKNKNYHSKLIINYIDLGKIRDYGSLQSYYNYSNFSKYTEYI